MVAFVAVVVVVMVMVAVAVSMTSSPVWATWVSPFSSQAE